MPGIIKYSAHNSLLPFYLAWRTNPNGYNYNLSFSYQFEDNTHIKSLIDALQQLIKLKAYLRQTFMLEGEQLIASIHEDLPAKVNFVTVALNDLPIVTKQLVEKKHNIEAESAIQLNIIQFNDSNNCSVIFNIHHIIMDGSSLDSFIMDLNFLLAGKSVEEEKAALYIARVENESLLQDGDKNPLFSNYLNEIKSINEEVDYSVKDHSHVIWRYSDVLPGNIVQELTALSKNENISFFNLLLLAYTVFISKLYNQSMVLVGYPVNILKDKSIPGCFLNSVTCPLRLETKDTFLSLIQSWPDKLEILKQASNFIIGKNEELKLKPYFAYSDFVRPHALVIANKHYPSQAYAQMANSNLNFRYKNYAGEIIFCCELFADVFPEYFAETLLPRFFNYLSKLIANSSAPLSTIELTFAEEKQKILQEFNNTDYPYPKDKTLVDLFDDIVKQYPDKIAVKAFNGSLTYSELNYKAEQLAGFLMEQGTQPEDIIGILIDNRLEMIVAVMAVLKAGAAYLPLTDNMPKDNLAHMLEDSNVKIVLTLMHLTENIDVSVTLIDINEYPILFKKYTKPAISPNNLAYIIYTSGTMGNPKGVLVEHRSIVNVVNYYLKSFQITNATNCSKYAEFSFDASIIEIFPSLLSGATLYIIPEQERKELSNIRKFFNESNINFGFLPTQLAELFLSMDNKQLQYLIVAGERLTQYLPVSFNVVNAYGATETSVHATSFITNKKDKNIPIGKPIDNVKCYVVDMHLNLLPSGIVGELLVGGESLARGYLNHLDLSTKKFIRNPFQTDEEKILKKNMLLYKTGDLVRWLPNGNLEYTGRNDFQVKIRGYRIELGEIESKLITHPDIKQTAVIAANRSNSLDKYLVAYYTANKKLNPLDISHCLKNKLPEYMLPSLFIRLDKLPLTSNGKIDKKSLPYPDFTNVHSYLAPTNIQEQLVCTAFSKILGLKTVGVNDDFFSLGGNSIKAITLAVNLQNNFKINVNDIFNLRTPRKIVECSPLEKNSLKQNLENIKSKYRYKKISSVGIQDLEKKLEKYQDSIKQFSIHCEQKLIQHILLTGATGFLGCNLLDQLLTLTDYSVYLLVRAPSAAEAFERINKKFKFYFNRKLDAFYQKRLFIYSADIEKEYLGLSSKEYKTLTSKVDSIIHSAALTKHYGEYDKFYSINVVSTVNLLKFCQATQAKDFHYISTTSVFEQKHLMSSEQYIFTEEDLVSPIKHKENPYISTKRLAEKEVIRFRKQGINSNIYRMGNLVFMAKNNCIQENSDDNCFLSRLKFLLNLGVIAEEMNLEEISPVDLAAQAIIKLFDKKVSGNGVYHIFNPQLFNIAKGFLRQGMTSFKIVPINQFIDIIIQLLDNPGYQKNIERYLLHQGWLNETRISRTIDFVSQDKTEALLQSLGFKWPSVEYKILNHCLELELENAVQP